MYKDVDLKSEMMSNLNKIKSVIIHLATSSNNIKQKECTYVSPTGPLKFRKLIDKISNAPNPFIYFDIDSSLALSSSDKAPTSLLQLSHFP